MKDNGQKSRRNRDKDVSDKKTHKELSGKETKQKEKIVNVYNAEFGEIDICLDEIRKECRRNGLDNYACNNIKIILNDTLKRVKLSNK
jgi:hypothetical protein|tara:strand:- start:1765 stop:2028 length:264 start_codon:yes stop_codon:yes gene_type:complete